MKVKNTPSELDDVDNPSDLAKSFSLLCGKITFLCRKMAFFIHFLMKDNTSLFIRVVVSMYIKVLNVIS